MTRKWIFGGAAICIVAVTVFVYTGANSLKPGGMQQSEVMGGPLLELSEEEVPLSESVIQEETSELRETALRVIELVNAERLKAGLGELSETDLLIAASGVRAAELEKQFSHTRPDGSLCFSVFSEFEIQSKARAENIALGHKSPEQVVDAWMKSDGHRKNILNPDYNKIGVGVYLTSAGKYCWVQLFTD